MHAMESYEFVEVGDFGGCGGLRGISAHRFGATDCGEFGGGEGADGGTHLFAAELERAVDARAGVVA
jgi:hypothetical protein